MVLTRSQVRAFYDRFGKKQDSQAFYEDRAMDDLIAHSAFEEAQAVFEFGCGTGRLASRLLSTHLPPSALYLGVDLSQSMVGIAEKRLSTYAGRAGVVQSDGTIRFPLPDRSVDRVVATYVLDLLSETDILQIVFETRRVLKPGGKICLVSLTDGAALGSRMVSALWSAIFRLHAPLVGGCRPIHLDSVFNQQDWLITYRNVVTRFGVSSEVLIAGPNSGANE